MFLYKKRKKISYNPMLPMLFFMLCYLIVIGIYNYFENPFKIYLYIGIFLIITFSIIKLSDYIYNKRCEKNQKEIKNI